MKKNPPSRLKDLTGQRFGKLVVIKRVQSRGKAARWLCECDCGKYKEIDSNHLRNGSTKSCGCLVKESEWNKKHGLSNSRIYNIWDGMKDRCLKKRTLGYKNYGGRGITICEEWANSFSSFYNWSMSHGYKNNLSIERIDVNGGYEPSNCKWATPQEQANNKRNNIFIEYKNEKHTLAQWTKILGIKYNTLAKRLKKMSVNDAFETEVNVKKSHIKQWSE